MRNAGAVERAESMRKERPEKDVKRKEKKEGSELTVSCLEALQYVPNIRGREASHGERSRAIFSLNFVVSLFFQQQFKDLQAIPDD